MNSYYCYKFWGWPQSTLAVVVFVSLSVCLSVCLCACLSICSRFKKSVDEIWFGSRCSIKNILNGFLSLRQFSQFLPRDAMRKCGLCYRPLSVRLSVTLVYCINTAEDIVNPSFFLPRPGSPIILVFTLPWRRYPIPRGTPSSGRKIHGVGKICEFRPKSPFISETVRDRPMVAMERLFEVIDGLRNGIIFDDLEWPGSAFQGHCILQVEYINMWDKVAVEH